MSGRRRASACRWWTSNRSPKAVGCSASAVRFSAGVKSGAFPGDMHGAVSGDGSKVFFTAPDPGNEDDAPFRVRAAGTGGRGQPSTAVHACEWGNDGRGLRARKGRRRCNRGDVSGDLCRGVGRRVAGVLPDADAS